MGEVIDEAVFRLKRGKFCPHTQAEVDEYARIVTCAKCGAPLDPFGVVLNLAREENRFGVSIQRLRAEQKRLSDSVEDLKREERNTRARLRRLGRTEGKRRGR